MAPRLLGTVLLILASLAAAAPRLAHAQQPDGPVNVGVTVTGPVPVGGTGATFTATYRDVAGARALDLASLHLARQVSVPGCSVHYAVRTGTFAVTVPNGTLLTAGPPGMSALTEGIGCALDPAQSRATVSGTTLTVTFRIVFRQEMEQTLRMFMEATERTGASTFREDKGEVTVGRGAQPPSLGTVRLNRGDVNGGEPITVTASYRDPNGWTDLAFVYLHVTEEVGTTGCMVRYDVQSKQLGVRLESEHWVNVGTPGQSRSEEGFRCSLDAGPSAALGEGEQLDVRFALRFDRFINGRKQVLAAAVDRAAKPADWTTLAAVTIRQPDNFLARAADARVLAGMIALGALAALVSGQRPYGGWGALAGAALATVVVPTPPAIAVPVAVLLTVATVGLVAWRLGLLDRWLPRPAAEAPAENGQ